VVPLDEFVGRSCDVLKNKFITKRNGLQKGSRGNQGWERREEGGFRKTHKDALEISAKRSSPVMMARTILCGEGCCFEKTGKRGEKRGF